MQQKFTYTCFGLCIETPFQIPYLDISNDTPQVVVQFGSIPKALNNVLHRGPYYELNENEFLMQVEQVAGYFAGKDHVIIEPAEGVQEQEIAVFLLGSVMGFVLQRNGLLPFHGSAVTNKKETIIFTGNSGAGKSTIAAFFVQQGWHLVADDICSLSLHDNILKLHKGIVRSKLWVDSIKQLSLEQSSRQRVRENMEKFHVQVMDDLPFNISKLSLIVQLGSYNNPGVALNEIKGLHKFQVLQRNVYRKLFIKEAQTQMFFGHLQKLAEVPLLRMQRPSQGFYQQEIYDNLQSFLTHA